MKTANKELIKHINSLVILTKIRECREISRADIAKLTGLNPATVSTNTKYLKEKRLIKEIGIGSSSGGRKPVLYRINDKDIYAVGIFISTDFVNCGLINLLGDIYIDRKVYFKGGIDFDEVMDIVYRLTDEILDIAEKGGDNILGIGVGIHGLVNSESGKSIHAPSLNWKDKDISEQLNNRYNLHTLIDNDCRVMAIGEKWFGKAKNSRDFILLHLDKGIGAGIYIDDKLFRGSSYSAGEIGHISILGNEKVCSCGRIGCLESIASEGAIIKEYGLEIDLDELIALAMNKDSRALKSLQIAGKHIGYGMAILVNLLNPSQIIIAGRVSSAFDIMYSSMHSSLALYGIDNSITNLHIDTSSLGKSIGIIGSATLVFENLLKEKQI